MNQKKPRIQSPLDLLPLHQKQALMGWLTTGGEHGAGITYRVARQRLLSQFGVRTSGTALSDFYHRCHKAAPAAAGIAVTPAANGFTITINVRLLSPVG